MARSAGRAIGVEVIPEAVEDAKQNAARNGLENVTFLCADAGQAAQQAFFARLHAGVTAEEFGVLRTVLGKMLQNAQGEDQYGV